MVTITYQYCRFCGSTFDTHHIGDPLVWVARVACKLRNCRWKYRLKTFLKMRNFWWSNDSWSVLTPFILKKGADFFFDWPVWNWLSEIVNKMNMNRTARLFIWKQYCVIRLLVFVFKLHLTSLWKQKKQYFVPTSHLSHLLTRGRVRFFLH